MTGRTWIRGSIITATLALTTAAMAGCGSTGAKPTSAPTSGAPTAPSTSTPATTPAATSTPANTSATNMLASATSASATSARATSAQPTAAAGASKPARSTLVQSADGVALVAPDGTVVYQFAPAVASADGSTVVSTTAGAGTTKVIVHDGRTGKETNTTDVKGTFVPVVVGGGQVVLADAPTPSAKLGTDQLAAGRARTHIAVVDLFKPNSAKTFDLAGNFMPEAVSLRDSDAATIVLLEYLPSDRPTSYRVQALYTGTGDLSAPLRWTDKAIDDDVMQGIGRTHVLSPSGGVLYTLYRAVPTSARAGHAFIHVLGLDFVRVYCLDLPDELGFANQPGALATSADGKHVYALNRSGTLAEITMPNEDAFTNETPSIVRTTALALATVPSNTRPQDATVSLVANDDGLFATVGATYVKIDPATLAIVEHGTLPKPATALAITDGTTLVASGTDLQRRDAHGAWTSVATLPTTMASPSSLLPLS